MSKTATTRTRKTAAPKTTPATKAVKPASPAVVKPATKPSNCGCGCGSPALTSKGTFLPGHDARLAGVLGRAVGSSSATEAQRTQIASLSSPLQAKIAKIAQTERTRAVEKAARIHATAVAKAAYDLAFADYVVEHGSIKA